MRTRGSNPSSSEADHRQALQSCGLLEQMERSLDLLGVKVEFLLVHDTCAAYLTHDGARMADGLNHVARAGLTLGADERCTFGNAAQGLAEVTRTTHERYLEPMLVDVMLVICWSEHLRFVDVINANSLQNLI